MRLPLFGVHALWRRKQRRLDNRSQDVTISKIVYGVMSILSRREYVRAWQGWDPVLNEPVWDMTYDSFWDLIQVALPFVATRIATVTIPDQSVADEPVNSADIEKNTVDKVLEAVKTETGILLEDILGDALKHAKEGTLKKIRARGDVTLSDIEISNDRAVVTGSFENAGSEKSRSHKSQELWFYNQQYAGPL